MFSFVITMFTEDLPSSASAVASETEEAPVVCMFVCMFCVMLDFVLLS